MRYKYNLMVKGVIIFIVAFAGYIVFFGIDRPFYGALHYASRMYYGKHIEYAELHITLPKRWSKSFFGSKFFLIRSPDDEFGDPVYVILSDDYPNPLDFSDSVMAKSRTINGVKYDEIREFLGHKYMLIMFGECVQNIDEKCDFISYVPSNSSVMIKAGELKKSDAWILDELLKNIRVSG